MLENAINKKTPCSTLNAGGWPLGQSYSFVAVLESGNYLEAVLCVRETDEHFLVFAFLDLVVTILGGGGEEIGPDPARGRF